MNLFCNACWVQEMNGHNVTAFHRCFLQLTCVRVPLVSVRVADAVNTIFHSRFFFRGLYARLYCRHDNNDKA